MQSDQYRVAASADDAWVSSAGTFDYQEDFLRFGRAPGKGAPSYSFYVRFAIDIEPHSVIRQATITFTRRLANTAQHSYAIRIENSQDAPPLTQKPTALTGTPITAAIPPGSAGATWTTPDLAALLQLWHSGLAGAGYAPGEHVVFALEWQSSGSQEVGRLESFEGNVASAALLNVSYVPPIPGGHVRQLDTAAAVRRAAAEPAVASEPVISIVGRLPDGTVGRGDEPAATVALRAGDASVE